MFAVIPYILVFITGATGLIYQVTWQKYVSTLVGSHASSVAAILSLFFLFLAMGYFVFGRYAGRLLKNQFALYGIIELTIGLYALYSPSLFAWIFELFLGTGISAQGLGSALILCAAFTFLPTFLMGGTIPILTQALSANFELSARTHAIIYGVNTSGAVFGCLLGGLVLLEHLGLDGTLLLSGNVNIAVAICTFLYIALSKQAFEGPNLDTGPDDRMPKLHFLTLLGVSFLSGYYTFSLEKLVIRMAGLSLGSTTYTYTIVVAAFILAIAVGSVLLTMSKRFERPSFYLFTQISALIASLILYFSVPQWPEIFFRVRGIFQSHAINFEVFWATVFFVFLIIIILPVGLIGANLPLLFGILRQRQLKLNKTVGNIYAVNSLGSAVGAAFGGYWIFHFFDASAAYKFLLMAMVLASTLTTVLFFKSKVRQLLLVGLALLAFSIFLVPRWKDEKFAPGLYLHPNLAIGVNTTREMKDSYRNSYGKLLFNHFDPNTVASVFQSQDQDRNLSLLVNGKPDAHTGVDNVARAFAALTPISLVPQDLRSIFIVGLGAGHSAAIFSQLEETEQVDIAEISEGVVMTLPFFKNFNFGMENRMQKVNIHIGDAYQTLMKKGKYDLIVSEPSNPWVTGIDKLYSLEFYRESLNHLNQDGVYIQWFTTSGVDEKTISIVLRTFREVFPFAVVYSARGALTFVGSIKEIRPNIEVATKRFRQIEDVVKKYDLSSPYEAWLGQIMSAAMLDAVIVNEDEVNSIFAPTLEYRAGRAYFSGAYVDLEQLLKLKLPLPLPQQIEGNKFIIDEYLHEVSTDTIVRLAKKLQLLSPITVIRLKALLAKKDPRARQELAALDPYNQFPFLLLGEEIFSKEYSVLTSLQKFELLLYQFRQLIIVGERPRFLKIDDVVKGQCHFDKEPADGERIRNCIVFLRAAINGLGGPEMVKDISLIPFHQSNESTKTQIMSRWQQIRATYNKLKAL